MKRVALIIVIASTLLAVAAGGLWLRSRSTWEAVYVRTGAWFWEADSSQGSITLQWYAGWPSPRAYWHNVWSHDPLKEVGPVFAIQYAGAGRSKWRFGPFEGERGTTRVVVGPSGTVRWNAPVLPIMMAFQTARLSPLIRFWSILLPDWIIVALFLSPATALGARRVAAWLLRRSRHSRGLCPDCGYDLRGSTGRCPECGRHIGTATAAAPVET